MPVEKTSQSRVEKPTNSIHIIIVSNPESKPAHIGEVSKLSESLLLPYCSGNTFVPGNTSHYLAMGLGREPFYHLLGLSDKENNNYRESN